MKSYTQFSPNVITESSIHSSKSMELYFHTIKFYSTFSYSTHTYSLNRRGHSLHFKPWNLQSTPNFMYILPINSECRLRQACRLNLNKYVIYNAIYVFVEGIRPKYYFPKPLCYIYCNWVGLRYQGLPKCCRLPTIIFIGTRKQVLLKSYHKFKALH